jgi:hypothetical protein
MKNTVHTRRLLRFWQNDFLQSATCVFCLIIAAVVATAAHASSPAPSTTAQRKAPVTSSTLFMRYRDFLGSDANARSVIQGLRYGELITRTGGAPGSIKFLPPTHAMSWANIDRTLDAVQSGMASVGITQPSPAELKTVLTGGTVAGADGRRFAMKGRGAGPATVSFASSASSRDAAAPATSAAPNSEVSVPPSAITH